jgi:hypothetical protein
MDTETVDDMNGPRFKEPRIFIANGGHDLLLILDAENDLLGGIQNRLIHGSCRGCSKIGSQELEKGLRILDLNGLYRWNV